MTTDLQTHLNCLREIISRSQELLEGNCFYIHQTLNQHPDLEPKQRNLLFAGKGKKRVMEIGFNGGHSCLLFLLADPSSQIVLFDLGVHRYTHACFEYLHSAFPGRLSIIYGDSRTTVPDYRLSHPSDTFDLIHVDGGHAPEVVNADMDNSRLLSRPDTLVIYDDIWMAALRETFDDRVASGTLEPVSGFEPTHMYAHALCRFRFTESGK